MIFKKATRYFMVFFYAAAGLAHFFTPSFFLAIVPPSLPLPLVLVYISGFFELLFGIALLTKYKKWGAYGLILLLIAVFPANIYLAISPEAQEALETSKQMAILRLPFHFLFIGIAYWHSKKD